MTKDILVRVRGTQTIGEEEDLSLIHISVRLHDRILYDRVPDLRDDACTALLRVLSSEGEGKYPGLRHHESSAEWIPFLDGEAFKEKSDGHGNRRCACDLLPVPCDKVKDRAYAGR